MKGIETMNNNHELKEANIYKEDGRYYMKLIYEYETESGFYRRTYPKVSFPYTLLHLPSTFSTTYLVRPYISLNDDLDICDTDCIVSGKEFKCVNFVDELIKAKVHEMTLEEIEKKLGYTVKIVSK